MPKKIIGKGLIGKAFENSTADGDITIFASGISNSKETNLSLFDRELSLIHDSINYAPENLFIYFSTCSILSGEENPYISHKILFEDAIREKSRRYLIIRLPQIVGLTTNNTLVSYFVRSIINNTSVNIYNGLLKNLLSVDDVVRLTDEVALRSDHFNTSITFASRYSISPLEIYLKIAKILNQIPKYQIASDQIGLIVNADIYRTKISSDDVTSAPEYWINVLKKYVPLIYKKIINEQNFN